MLWKCEELRVAVVGAVLAVSGCAEESAQKLSTQGAAAESRGSSTSLGELPLVPGLSVASTFAQKLARPTPLGETAAVYLKLPPPTNRLLSDSLVRVVGDPARPTVLFHADTLARLGAIPSSPGPDFFTLFAQLPDSEVERRQENERRLASGELGVTTRESILFNGRHPVARYEGLPMDAAAFGWGERVPVTICPLLPLSTQPQWERTLMIRDPAVVLDPARTWDPCTGAGTKGGVWTFAHLMREMAQGSGASPEAFVLNWLSLWLNDFQSNGDTVPARRKMYDEVIAPWAAASGATSSFELNASTGRWEVSLSKPLDLGIAPFRLLSIVNRIDLARSWDYADRQTDPGELRFIFGLTRPSPWGGGTEATCNLKPFTVIFEYGVPGEGCAQVVDWARQWALLGTYPSFNAAYKARLTQMTQSVVLRGKGPGKGNGNALNQIRTNEAALASPWELREFRLVDEHPVTGKDKPSNGFLRVHTMALTPDDATHDSETDPDIDSFVRTQVKKGVEQPVTLPNRCTAQFTVPRNLNGRPFLGANALVASPTHWEGFSVVPTDAAEVCARKEFSVNTCNGCHFKDTGTNDFSGVDNVAFTHVSPTSGIPARLSKFLTGGGAGSMYVVPDAQFGAGVASWPFADLLRRHQRLQELANCTTCGWVRGLDVGYLARMEALAGSVPLDVPPGSPEPTLSVGPIRDVGVVKQLLELRQDFKTQPLEVPLNFLRPPEAFVH
ncbi:MULTISPECIES: hypothetical protein [unclassified Corallococcus]|uniref:hypothetical protein n=1 Tax=unclassified Corallococcus TaxID=2685029 RepID=UPI001A8DB1E1|nr:MULTISPECIES: hypothetical protein [unclassified Corallococcus]MBN9688263.1 hypothetical protein [Corallococcus sp. NCSPR001]WAS87933.1 hypothetical protein O0N60_13360 [Corallococcus sp. NCRR]